jgi:uncharacterized protein YndB with AHSA1/START domain
MPSLLLKLDAALDLVLEREVEAPRALVWAAWTKPEHLCRWFAPEPWTIPTCEIDLRPGGIFHCVMCSPDGKEYPNVGCYLEVAPEERLVWTDGLLPGFRPATDPLCTTIVALEAHENRTRYIVTAMHADEARRLRHEEVGFRRAWGNALDQLDAYVTGL